MSLAQNDFPAIDDLVKHWQPEISRLGFENDAEYTASADTIFKELGAKAEAGFPVSFADLFGRAVGYQFIPGEKGGIGATFSDVLEKSRFRSHEMPMPMTHLVEIDTDDEVFFGFPLPSTDANIVCLQASLDGFSITNLCIYSMTLLRLNSVLGKG